MPNQLGADPGKAIVHFNGFWALVILLVTLSITPLRMFGWNLVFLRRMIGLFAFFYASLHLSSYVVFLLELNFSGIVEDVVKRPYITVGMLAFTGLVALAATSNRRMMRKLGRRWKQLHRLVYPIAILVVIHFLWQTRSDFTEPFIFGSLLALLLGIRIVNARRKSWYNRRR